MIDIAIKSGIVSCVGWGVVLFLRRSSASVRYFVLALTLLSLGLLPCVLHWLPRWQAPFIHADAPSAPLVVGAPRQAAAQPIPWPFAIWAAGAVVLAVRFGYAMARLALLRVRVPHATDSRLLQLCDECLGRRTTRFDLVMGGRGVSPMTWGWWRPALLLPEEAVDWSDERLLAILHHEIAHIERQDWLTTVLAEAVCLMHWPNPFVWLISQRMASESEKAADDRVLSSGVRASAYAGQLLSLVLEGRGQLPPTSLAMAKPAGLDSRVRSILSDGACRRPVRGSVAVSLCLGMAAFAGVVGTAGPTLVHRIEAAEAPDLTVDVTSEGPIAEKLAFPAPMPSVVAKATARSRPSVGHVSEVRESKALTRSASPGVTRNSGAVVASSAKSETKQAGVTGNVELANEDFEDRIATNDDVAERDEARAVQKIVVSPEVRREIRASIDQSRKEVDEAMRQAGIEVEKAMRENAPEKDPKVRMAISAGLDAAKIAIAESLNKTNQSLNALSSGSPPGRSEHKP